MPETSIVPHVDMPQGTIKVMGLAHGAVNTLVVYDQYPEDFEFKQFVTREAMDTFARTQNLIISEG